MEHTKEKDHKDVHEGERPRNLLGHLHPVDGPFGHHRRGRFEKDLSHYFSFANAFLAMVIAVVKATLVILFFMHVRHGTKLIWIRGRRRLLHNGSSSSSP